MKIWLSKNSEVPIREQLIAQITIGVFGGDLVPGDKLPSTQEVARRYSIHANTVSSAYRELADRGLIEFRKGSGFYVCRFEIGSLDTGFQIEKLVGDSLRAAEGLGLTARQFVKRLENRITAGPPNKIVVVETNEALRRILTAEICASTSIDVISVGVEELENLLHEGGVLIAAMNHEKSKIDSLLSASSRCQYLSFRSVAGALTGKARPSENELVAIVSVWETFLALARTMLVAAGVDPETLVIRLLDEPKMANSLDSASMIVCDYYASQYFNGDPRVQVFKLIADESVGELKKLADGTLF